MKRIIAAALLALMLFVTPAQSHESSVWTWEATAASVDKSVVSLIIETADGTGTCTAWSVDKKNSIYFTAAHCFGVLMMLDGTVPTHVLFIDEPGDLMVLQADTPYQRPALHPSHNGIRKGMPVAALGFGMGWPVSMFRAGEVSVAKLIYKDFAFVPYTIFDFAFIGGMSGGPVFDVDGNVVAIVNASFRDGTMSAGRTLAALRAFYPAWK